MSALRNPKHEQFCHNLISQPTQKDAYLATIPNVTERTASVQSSRLLSNSEIRNRFFELLRESKCDLPHISNRFTRWLNDDEAPVQSWDAVKTGLKIYGILDSDEKSGSNMQNIQINITTLAPDSNA